MCYMSQHTPTTNKPQHKTPTPHIHKTQPTRLETTKKDHSKRVVYNKSEVDVSRQHTHHFIFNSLTFKTQLSKSIMRNNCNKIRVGSCF